MHKTDVMRRFAVFAIALALGVFAAPTAHAANDADGTFTDTTGVVWQSYTRNEYLANATVQDMQRVMAGVANGDFRATESQEMEGEVMTTSYIYFRGVTRIVDQSYSGKRTVTYVKGDRQCTRNATSKKSTSISHDDPGLFRCGKRGKYTDDAAQFAERLLPINIVDDVRDERYLLHTEPTKPDKGELAAMPVVVVSPADLTAYGISQAPVATSSRYWIGPDTIGRDYFNRNPLSSVGSWSQLWSTKVPTLPKAMRRAVS